MIVELTRLAPELNEAGLQFEKDFKKQNSEDYFRKLIDSKKSQQKEEDEIDRLIRESGLGTDDSDDSEDKLEFMEIEEAPKFDYQKHYSYLEMPYAFMLDKLIDITQYESFTKLEFGSDIEVLIKESKTEVVNKIRQTVASLRIKH
jgi:hypothetical protein